MLKLYKFTDTKKEYWETWDNDDGSHTVHWGELGTTGQSKEVKSSLLKKPEKIIQKEVDEMVSNGFRPIDDEFTLLIEYAVDGMGSKEDVEKRHRLQDKMNETLGWAGLGHCDGGSIGSGTMEVCNYVVDFEVAKSVIENDLKGTEFENYTRIYDEEAE
ncbi:hypothetical protein Sbal183_3416 [Shewanella baltica OS183]|uniref:hypothetical protein n=1 Tax=Shewanella baltica TaxID=62322 RepID=UPI0001E10B87|nr:hypothetical protein [Shewanella baltica]AEG10173.1 hypothetical protein Sbal175_0893 [Shewanella baltica BA175]EHQ16297.1 hypothetical protein Sbal183_3416 [Shewanella baltica OS183]